VRIEAGAQCIDSLITDGSVIAGGAIVERSVLSPGVYVGPNAVVRESIILTDSYIEAGAVVERAVIDKNCVIGHNARVGEIIKDAPDLGIVMVGKNTHLPNGIIVRRNACIGSDLRAEDLTDAEIAEGRFVSSSRRDD
jgi:glucose-1-phosphate adenylyltransferase